MKRITMQRSIAQPAQPHLVGQTQAAGFQIGARKTFAVAPQRAWEILTSRAGVKLWLGDVAGFKLVPGHLYKTRDGAEGEVRVVQVGGQDDGPDGPAGGHFRMTWRPKQWRTASTIQVRVMPSGDKTVISFHQENLAGPGERKEMYLRWQKVLQALPGLLAGGE